MVNVFLIIVVFLSFAQHAEAIDAPAPPVVSAPYVRELLQAVQRRLLDVQSSGGMTGSDAEKSASKARAAAEFRSLFLDLAAARAEPARDIDRTACFMADLVAIEQMIMELVARTLTSAENLDGIAEQAYRGEVEFLWGKLWQIRRFGLDPSVQVPIVAGTGTGAAPRNATATSDDALCPYSSLYAPAGFAGLGCQEDPFEFLGDSVILANEASIMLSILHHIGGDTQGIARELPLYRYGLQRIWADADAFVKGIQMAVAPRPRLLTEPILSILSAALNTGETGCLGWPSASRARIVTGENVTKVSRFPDPLTRELADTLDYLRVREDPLWLEYVRDMNRRIAEDGGGALGYTMSLYALEEQNRDHVIKETGLILSLRDPQIAMENLANVLHNATRTFTAQTVTLAGSATAGVPPLREFVGRLTWFLLHMCQNRGCTPQLLRTYELGMRDECFPSFRSAIFFLTNPGAITLPPCQSKYAGQ